MMVKDFIKYITISILINSILLGSVGLNINIHQCSQGENMFMKIVLPWTTENNCELCHDDENVEVVKEIVKKKEASCCQIKEEIIDEKQNNEEKDDCCEEKEFLVKNDIKINKVIYLILAKIDYKIKHIDRFISNNINIKSISNITLIPPNLRVLLQSLTI